MALNRYLCELINNNKDMNQKLKRIRQILVGLVLIVVVVGISSCEKYSYLPPTVDLIDTLYFQAEIQTIFDNNCITCHGAIQKPILSDGKSYTNLTEGGYINPPETAETSRLYVKMISGSHAAKSTDVDKQKVLIWITQGALNN